MNISSSNNQSAQRFFNDLFTYNVSLVPCNSFKGKTIFKCIYLPKLVSNEQLRSTIRTNTLLAEIWHKYKFWIFKIHCPSPICIFFFFFSIRKFIALSREQYYSCIHKNNCWYDGCAIQYLFISLFLNMNNFDWFI